MLRNIKNIHEIKLDGDLTPTSRTGLAIQDLLLNRNDSSSYRFDNTTAGSAGLFLLRQLQYVRSTVMSVEYPENKALTFIPLATDILPSVSQYVYYVRDRTGKSRIQNPNAEGPLPRFDIQSDERYGKVVSLEGCYGWTIDELREAARLMIDLPTAKAENARDILLRDTDEVIRTGQLTFTNGAPAQVASGIGGFLNHAEVAVSGTALDGVTYGKTMHDWFVASTTSDQMANDLFDLEQTIKAATLATFVPDTLVLATALMNRLISTKMSTASDKNVLKYYLENSRYIKNIEEWIYLDGAGVTDSGTGAGANKHRAVMYARDKRVLEAVNPIEFEQQAAQVEGFGFTIPCRAKVGGVKFYNPRAAIYADFSTKTS
jgi:hypothetical protein